jgi:predicted peroxiredoxin
MASELFIGTHGSENPTKASIPFVLASGALDAGHQTAIILTADAVLLMNSSVVENVQGVGFPPLKEVMAKIITAKVPIYI